MEKTENKIITNSLEDYLSHNFNVIISRQIYNIANLQNKTCQFCDGKFNEKAYYYKHESGYQTNIFYERIWIWFECSKCGHQWSLTHLGLSRKYHIILH